MAVANLVTNETKANNEYLKVVDDYEDDLTVKTEDNQININSNDKSESEILTKFTNSHQSYHSKHISIYQGF